MGRDGNGNAWRYRQYKPRFSHYRTPRQFQPRTLLDEPQFTFEDLYISPLHWKRRYSEQGELCYVDLPKPKPTGIRMFDAYLYYLSEGNSDLKAFADQHGLRRDDIDSMVFILTGMRGVDFRLKFQLRMAEELLRFTSLSLAEVARRSGIGSANNLYLTYKREFNIAPGYRRLQLRNKGDVGLYKV